MADVLHIKGNKKGIGLGTTATTDSKIKLGWNLKLNGNKINGLVDLVYPVGSIYTSTVSTNPGTLFGGTWTQITDRFLIGANSTYTAGSTGGEANVTLAAGNMGAHTHSLSVTLGSNGAHTHTTTESAAEAGSHSHVQNSKTWINVKGKGWVPKKSGYYATADLTSYSTNAAGAHTHTTSGTTSEATTHSHTVSGNTAATGSGTAHNNMPPYLAVYMWKRTA